MYVQSVLLTPTRAARRAWVCRLVHLSLPRRRPARIHRERLGSLLRRGHGAGAPLGGLARVADLGTRGSAQRPIRSKRSWASWVHVVNPVRSRPQRDFEPLHPQYGGR
jgi:hypothetical protein